MQLSCQGTMNLQASNSEQASSSFFLLDDRIQRWIWESGWDDLKDVQEQSIPIVLNGEHDAIIAAATASGKTEAAFLPILTRLLQSKKSKCVIYISPLKALINDQWGRLEQLCELLEIPVIPWHGDISGSKKKKFLKTPSGCLLITPESLEAMLISSGHVLSSLFSGLAYIVIDELHAFIGTERGKQLQTQLQRIDSAVKRKVPRIALSATLGDMGKAAEYLRPRSGEDIKLIISRDNNQELKVIVKGYSDDPSKSTNQSQESVSQSNISISNHLFEALRGSNNLVFPNSRAKVELYTDLLRRHCEKLGLPNEFWPHHGSLAKDIRQESEAALKLGDRPSTAICTTTLELGIDIGSVKSVAQIGPAPSVASLRQRLGRSGRRKGEPAILRCYVIEDEITADSSISDNLRESLIQTIAQIQLLIKGWYEPPEISGLHLSTFIQQLLSLIAQYGGISAQSAWHVLCETGPFLALTKSDFTTLLRHLASKEILMQDASGLLLHGSIGEKLVNHYTFYAAFTTEDEFRVICGGKTLGTLPLSKPVEQGSYIIFAGKRWKVEILDVDKKIIQVVPASGGKLPKFDGGAGMVSTEVRQEMFSILNTALPIGFLDDRATNMLIEARDMFSKLQLGNQKYQENGKNLKLFLWQGDRIMNTVALILKQQGLDANNHGLHININNTSLRKLYEVITAIVETPAINAGDLANAILNKQIEKWDYLLPDELLNRNFVSKNLDINGSISTLKSFITL
jgi:ATP-dependent helicase Lhr and Lhr-like helicase